MAHVRYVPWLTLPFLALLPAVAWSEWYVGGQVGGAFPQDFSGGRGHGHLPHVELNDVRFNDLELANSVVYGGKIGYYFDRLPFLGLEAETFVGHPHLKQQRVNAYIPTATISTTVLGQPVTARVSDVAINAPLRGSHITAVVPALNLVMRYPHPALQPYAGVGMAFLPLNGVTPGLNALVGLRGFLTSHIALFGELKYTYARLTVSDIRLPSTGGIPLQTGTIEVEGSASMVSLVGGISFHFARSIK